MAIPQRNVFLPEFINIVLPNKTLASLAEKNGIIDPIYLRLFHNGCCELNELLVPEVEEEYLIYLPLQEETVNIMLGLSTIKTMQK